MLKEKDWSRMKRFRTVSGNPGKTLPGIADRFKTRRLPHAIVLETIKKHDLPALNVAVAKDGEIVFSEGFGIAVPATGEKVERQIKLSGGSRSLTAWVTATVLTDDDGAASTTA